MLIFERRITRRTPSRYRSLTEGALVARGLQTLPHKAEEGRALRTETVVNDTYDFGIGRRLCNLDALIGFAANRRILRVQRISHDSLLGTDTFDQLHRPVVVDNRRVSALRFGEPRIQALLSALLAFRLLPAGFANRQLREHAAPLMGLSTETYSPNRATYDLRRLRLRGLVERIPHSHRYRVTGIALCYQRIHRRILSPALGTVFDEQTGPLIQRFDHEIQRLWEGHSVAIWLK